MAVFEVVWGQVLHSDTRPDPDVLSLPKLIIRIVFLTNPNMLNAKWSAKWSVSAYNRFFEKGLL
jgi:hypothetical protein